LRFYCFKKSSKGTNTGGWYIVQTAALEN
jgi:hypothetical protein